MNTAIVVATKVCRKCGETKAIEEFGVVLSFKDGRRFSCKSCYNKIRRETRKKNPEPVRVKKKVEYHRNREKYLAYNRSEKRKARWFEWKLKRQFGITPDDFNRLLESQNGKCAICKRHPMEIKAHRNKRRLHIDHDHKTGKVRGLLCNPCNVALGGFADDAARLSEAINYLKQFQIEQETIV